MNLLRRKPVDPPPPHCELVAITAREADADITTIHALIRFPAFALLTLGHIDRGTITLTDEKRVRYPDGSINCDQDEAMIDGLAARRALAAPAVDVLVCAVDHNGTLTLDAVTVRGYMVLGALDWKDGTVELSTLMRHDAVLRQGNAPVGAELTPALRGAMAAVLVRLEAEAQAELRAALPKPVLIAHGGDARCAAFAELFGVDPTCPVFTAANGAQARALARQLAQANHRPLLIDLAELGDEADTLEEIVLRAREQVQNHTVFGLYPRGFEEVA